MKIDFTKIMAAPTLDVEPQPIDIAKVLGNAIYNEAATIEEDALARRIHSSSGEIELSEGDVEIVRKHIQPFRFWLRKAVDELLTSKG